MEPLIDLIQLPRPSVVNYQLVIPCVEEQTVSRQAIKASGKRLVQGHDMMWGSFLQHQSHCLSHDSLFLMCHLLTGITGEIMTDLCLGAVWL